MTSRRAQQSPKSMASANNDAAMKSNGAKPACDRCRGQKLRCIWEPKSQQCRRCARANAVCAIPPPRPMGRPPRQFRGNELYFSWDSGSVSYDDDTILPVQPVDTSAINARNGNTEPLAATSRDLAWNIPSTVANTRHMGNLSPPPDVQPDLLEFLNWYVLLSPTVPPVTGTNLLLQPSRLHAGRHIHIRQ